jgi:hypothetical protein
MPLVSDPTDGPYHNSGLFASAGAGRTDIHNRQVPAGGYVVPADVVSALAEGNTLGGSAVLDRMMGTNKKTQKPNPSPMAGPAPVMQAKGGTSGKNAHAGQPTPVVVAGGEHYIPPEAIINKFGDLQRGHKILDAFVKNIRAKNIQTLKKLPGPKR